jgi:hypothetical protein
LVSSSQNINKKEEQKNPEELTSEISEKLYQPQFQNIQKWTKKLRVNYAKS